MRARSTARSRSTRSTARSRSAKSTTRSAARSAKVGIQGKGYKRIQRHAQGLSTGTGKGRKARG